MVFRCDPLLLKIDVLVQSNSHARSIVIVNPALLVALVVGLGLVTLQGESTQSVTFVVFVV